MKSAGLIQWWIGQLTSVLIGIGVAIQSTVVYGAAVAFALMVLVDIRHAVEKEGGAA